MIVIEVAPRRDLERSRQDRTVHPPGERELRSYVYGSAEVIGLMCLRVFRTGEEPRPRADGSGETEEAALEHGGSRLRIVLEQALELHAVPVDGLDEDDAVQAFHEGDLEAEPIVEEEVHGPVAAEQELHGDGADKLVTVAEGDLEKKVQIEKITADTLVMLMNDRGTEMKLILLPVCSRGASPMLGAR